MDENLDNDILRGVQRVLPDFDAVRVIDVLLSGKSDEIVLEWAAEENRIVVTHDVNTMVAHAWGRVARRQSMPGLIVIPQETPIGPVISDLAFIAQCGLPGDLDGLVRYLPLS
jgi:hypothetical protein